MKKLLVFFILFTISNLAMAMETQTAAVMDLEAEQGVSVSVSRMVSDYLRAQLFKTQ